MICFQFSFILVLLFCGITAGLAVFSSVDAAPKYGKNVSLLIQENNKTKQTNPMTRNKNNSNIVCFVFNYQWSFSSSIILTRALEGGGGDEGG